MRTTEMIDLSVLNERALQNNEPRTSDMRTLTNLRNACDAFASKSYEDFRTLHKRTNSRGLTAEAVGIRVHTYEMAGRIMITLNCKDNQSVTLLGGETPSIDESGRDKSFAGLHGIDCENIDDIFDMLEIITRVWYMFYDSRYDVHRTIFKDNANVSIV